jgi:hypothetical protein
LDGSTAAAGNKAQATANHRGAKPANGHTLLKELGKEFRRLNGAKMPAEIILVGGATILASYGFREITITIDYGCLRGGCINGDRH